MCVTHSESTDETVKDTTRTTSAEFIDDDKVVERIPLGRIDPTRDGDPLRILRRPTSGRCRDRSEDTCVVERSVRILVDRGQFDLPASATRLYASTGIACASSHS